MARVLTIICYPTKPRLAIYGVLILLALSVYGNSLSGDLVYDDLYNISRNALFGHWDYDTLHRVFTSDVASPIMGESSPISTYYRPLVSLFWMAAHEVAGYNPPRWHLISIALHAVTALLVFGVLSRSLDLGLLFEPAQRRTLSVVGASVFAVHPVQSESVAWISASSGLLLATLLLGSFLCYLISRDDRNTRGHRAAAFASCLLLYSLALLTKENAVTMLFLVGAYEFLILGSSRTIRPRLAAVLRRSLPFVLVTAAYVALRVAVLGVVMGRTGNANYPDQASLSMVDTLRTLPSLALAFLRLAALPFDYSVVYDVEHVRSFGLASFWVPLLVCAAAVTIVVYLSLRVPILRLVVIWFAIPLLPYLNSGALVSDELLHDRHLHLSMVGVGMLAAVLLMMGYRLLSRRLPVYLAPGAVVIPIIALGGLTAAQNRHWRSEETLWTRAVERAPNSRVARISLGLVAERKGDLEMAMRQYEAALTIHPDIVDALNNQAFVYAKKKDWPNAIANFERIVVLTPENPMSHFNLSFAYRVQGRLAEEASALRTAVELGSASPRLGEWTARLQEVEATLSAARPQP